MTTPRYSWKGYLRLSLVSVPVQAVNAQESQRGQVALHQLHEKDHSRIRYVKMCPQHGEVSADEIVSGYEVAKGEYVVIEPEELDALRTPAEKAITLDAFIAEGGIDPVYFDGRNYYLLPDGEAGAKPYTVLHQAMQKQRKWGVGQAVMFGREHLVVVRAQEELLALSLLNFDEDVRHADLFDIGEGKASATEVHLAETLIKASTPKRFDIARYRDEYVHKLRTLIDAKVAGREIVAPPKDEEPVIVNLMDALRASVANAGKKQPGQRRRKPAKRLAPSRQPATAKRRKTS